MKIIVQAMHLRVAKDSRAAGVARAVVQEVLHLALRPEVDAVRVYLGREANIPGEWEGIPKLDVRRVMWHRPHLYFSGVVGYLRGFRKVLIAIIGEHPLRGLPSWMMVYDIFPITAPEYYDKEGAERMARLLREDVAASRGYICISASTEKELHEVFPETVGRSRVVLLGPGNIEETVPEDPRAALAHLPLPKGPYLFTLSTIEPRKNMPRLLEALAIARRTDPSLTLVIAGGKGWLEGETFDTVTRLGLEDAVTFLGYVNDEDVPSLYRAAALFIFPSLNEGFGIPALEAMIYGTPCLLSTAGALPEVGGDVARYFDPLSTEDMAGAIVAAMADEEWRRTAVVQGKERAKLFSWDNVARVIVETMRSVK